MKLSWRKILSRLSRRRARARFAAEMCEQGDRARTEGRRRDAAVLYEASWRLVPNPRIAVQAGHMFKEAGDWPAAERHYLWALARLGDNADMSLQLGHFYKVSGRPGEAARWYARACELAPSWEEPARELRSVAAAFTFETSSKGQSAAVPVPDLLPDLRIAEPLPLDAVVIRQLGRSPQADAREYLPTLCGVEAVRGVCLSGAIELRAELVLDGKVVCIADTTAARIAASDLRKHVFNIWHDFSHVALGTHRVEVRLVDRAGTMRRVRREAHVGPPLSERALPDCDRVVDPPEDIAALTKSILGRASMIRSARPSFFKRPPRSILVIRADQLGDMAVSAGAIQRLRTLLPDARLVGLVTRSNLALARMLDLFDDLEIVEWADGVGATSRTIALDEQRRLLSRLAAYRFDVAIDLMVNGDTRPLLQLSGAPCLVGFASPLAPWLTVSVDGRTRDPKTGEESASHAARLLGLVERFATLLDNGNPVAAAAPGLRHRLRRFDLAERRFAVLHSGGRLTHLQWPHFSMLAARLLHETDLHIVFFGDGTALSGLAGEPRVQIIPGEIDFDDFDALLAFATVFVGNDSGPKHLAALRGTPTVSLHSARIDWREWGQTQAGIVITRRVPCAGCSLHGEQEDECGRGYTCIADITVNEVMGAIAALLSNISHRSDQPAGRTARL